MSRVPPTYRKSVDKSAKAVRLTFGAAGCSVTVIQRIKAGLPDLLVGFRGLNRLVEAKNPSKSGRQTAASGLSDAQAAFDASWRGSRTNVARTPTEALALVKLWETEFELSREAARSHAAILAMRESQARRFDRAVQIAEFEPKRSAI